LAIAALGLSAAPAGASTGSGGSFHCNKTINGGTIASNVTVTNNAVCILNGVTVQGNVGVDTNAYFEASGSTITGNVSAGSALTVYIHNHSSVGGNVAGYLTAQIFVYDSSVGRNVAGVNAYRPGYGHFQVCGTTVSRSIQVGIMGPDVLIGDPAASCAGNTANTSGMGGYNGILVTYNTADKELYVIGNTATWGDIAIYDNYSASGDKQVHGNSAPNGDLICYGNATPFSGNLNATVGDVEGNQCSATTVTGNDLDAN
jgi:hypothetical protein